MFIYIYIYTISQHTLNNQAYTLYPAIQHISFLSDKLKNKYGFYFLGLRNLTEVIRHVITVTGTDGEICSYYNGVRETNWINEERPSHINVHLFTQTHAQST